MLALHFAKLQHALVKGLNINVKNKSERFLRWPKKSNKI